MKQFLLIVVVVCLVQISLAGNAAGHKHQYRAKQAGCCVTPNGVLHDPEGSKTIKTSTSGIYRNNIYKKRLDSISKDVQLDYNEYVQAEIDNYLTQRSDISREIGLARYYFPIYEKAFREAGIPDEIKYLSIVESQLNPNAVSRVGATGPWQFMSSTARIYGLTMDEYTDERRDPVQSSYAAAAYLKDAYEQFGDWLLAIASYNCGKDNVIRAIEEAGSSDFWAIRPYLPVETRGYVPCYIAMTYVMNYYHLHRIEPQSCNILLKTDTVQVDKMISLNSVSHVLSIDLNQLTILNPSYPRMLVNGSPSSPKTLVIPAGAKAKYIRSYELLNSELATSDLQSIYSTPRIQPVEKRTPLHHRLRKFENLVHYQKIHSANNANLITLVGFKFRSVKG